jgi:hypothetical protein
MHDRVALPAGTQATVIVRPREGALDDPTPSPELRAVLGSRWAMTGLTPRRHSSRRWLSWS